MVPAAGEPRATAEPEKGESFREWGRLMALAQAGDAEAYATLLQALALFLRGLGARHLGVGPDAEDAVQEILLAVHAIRHTYDPARPFGPWFLTIARRRLADALRQRSRRLARETELEGAAAVPASAGTDPSALAARVVDIAQVRRAVAGLPPRQREAVRLLRLEEMSLREAAAASGQLQGALKVAAHRALKPLRRLLARERQDGHAHD